MKHLLVTACVAIGAAAFAVPASAMTIYLADLSGASEVPPSASPGSGQLMATLHDDLETFDVSLTFADLIANDTAAHLHCCAMPGVNAAVRLNLNVDGGFPIGVMSGMFDHTFDLSADLTGITPADFITALDAGEVYINIHSAQFPGGEIRGQLEAAQVEAIPEPGSLTLMGMGLLGVVRAVRRRRRAA